MTFKNLVSFFLLMISSVAFASSTPMLYCVSTKTFNDGKSWPVNQINIFTNSAGSLKMSLQYHAWGQSEDEDATITTPMLLSLRQLSFDAKASTLKNSSGDFELALGKEISVAQAHAILAKKDVSFSFEDPAGMLVEFKKYRLAAITAFNYPGKRGQWSSTLMSAYKAGVNEYVCGDAKDIKR